MSYSIGLGVEFTLLAWCRNIEPRDSQKTSSGLQSSGMEQYVLRGQNARQRNVIFFYDLKYNICSMVVINNKMYLQSSHMQYNKNVLRLRGLLGIVSCFQSRLRIKLFL